MKVSVIISNRNDISMLVVTVRSIIEEFKPISSGCEIVIVDNSEQEVYESLRKVIPQGYLKDETVRIYRQDFPCLFTARECAIENSRGKYVICLDSHVLVGRNMIYDLVKFMDNNSDNEKIGFAHAPISWATQHERQARHDRDMVKCELGNWGVAYKYEHKMTWKGMPWICRREFFREELNGYGALSEHKLSWGGGDMHIGIKPWLLGYENWAVPTSPCIHLGPFKVDNKDIAKYRRYSSSGQGTTCIGFLVSCYVLGGEEMMERNREGLGRRFPHLDIDAHWDLAKRAGENEKRWLDKNRVMSFKELLRTRPWDDCRHNSKDLRATVTGAR